MSARQPPPGQLTAPAVAELSPVSGPDMQQLHRRYPARAADPSWQATRQDGGLLLARMLELPFTGKDQRVRRRRGLVSVIAAVVFIVVWLLAGRRRQD